MKLGKEEIRVEVDELKKLMDLLSNLFQIRTSFIYAIEDDQYETEIAGNTGDYQKYCRIIQEEMHHRCIACDSEHFKLATEKRDSWIYRCYSGLYEMFLPIFIEQVLVGYLHFGQVRSEDDFEAIVLECGLEEHTKLGELRKSYEEMEVISKRKLVLISDLFQKIAEIILKNKLVELRSSKPEHYLKKYIEDNFSKDISLSSAALYINRSSSFVTHKFKELYSCTFHQYLTKVRIETSKNLLKKYPIMETYQKCGFKNRYHFSKVFKIQVGVTPFEYQNSESRRP